MHGDLSKWSNFTPPAGALVAPAAAQSRIYEQCGGQNYDGDTSCGSGLECLPLNDYFHQCLPIPSLPGIPEYGPCGGDIEEVCVEGTECIFFSEFFSQCLRDFEPVP